MSDLAEKRYDLVIVGGGIAGAAAALEASRSGLRTALVEKTVLFGGLATSGLVPIYMPLDDGRRQVTFGIAEELVEVSLRYGPGRLPAKWAERKGGPGAAPADADPPVDEVLYDSDFANRYQTFYSPQAFALGLDEVLEQCGADLWLDTLACVPILEGGAAGGVEVENKSGRVALRARQVIDATGDADIAFRAGAPCRERGSWPSALYYTASLERARKAADEDNARRVAWRFTAGANEFDRGYDGPSDKTTGTDGRDVSAWLLESRRLVRERLAADQAEAATPGGLGRENLYPTALPTMPQIRMSRCIEGAETVREEMKNRRSETSVGLIADGRQIDAVWEVPYGALVPRGTGNLLAAGRCASAEGYAWQVTRLIAPAALTGQVAAIAARLAIEHDTSPDRLDAKLVCRATEARGVPLHL